MQLVKKEERRSKCRFEMQREVRYRVTGDRVQEAAGTGHTLNICSGGVAFAAQDRLQPGSFVEVSISWPVLLDDTCPMRLIAFGRVLRCDGQLAVCSIEKYEFRTAARTFQADPTVRTDSMLHRWANGMRKGIMKESVARA